jgi:hypothetical protein
MKSTATCTIWFEDGTEVKHVNVTYSRWSHDDKSFVVQRYDPDDENRLQTFVYKREHIKTTVREQDYTDAIDLTEKPTPDKSLDDSNPPSIRIREGKYNCWIIVYGAREDLAWSGSRWLQHIGGNTIGTEQVFNFADKKEAETYAKTHFPNATRK